MKEVTYVIGAIAGLIFGGAAGQLKNFLIWQKYLKAHAAENSGTDSLGGLYARSFISYAVNILVLAAAFFMREVMPFDGIAFLIGTAVGLTIMNKVLALGQKKQEDRRKEQG
ncbi:hypothetical protein D3Z38_00140 [Clostridiales bacterium]|nr:hypothetical protein [Clostridiales bacterium]